MRFPRCSARASSCHPQPGDGSWECRISRNKWEGRVPDERFALLRAFVGGPNGQELALAGEDRLVAVVRDELAALIGLIADPMLVRTQSWDGGLHQYTLGHVDRVARAESALAAHPGLAWREPLFMASASTNASIRVEERRSALLLAGRWPSRASAASFTNLGAAISGYYLRPQGTCRPVHTPASACRRHVDKLPFSVPAGRLPLRSWCRAFDVVHVSSDPDPGPFCQLARHSWCPDQHCPLLVRHCDGHSRGPSLLDRRSPARWSYTTFVGAMLVLLSVAIVSDILTIVAG